MENNWYDNDLNNSVNGSVNNNDSGARQSYQPNYQPYYQPQKPNKRFSWAQLIVCVLVVALLSGCIGAGALWVYNKVEDRTAQSALNQDRRDDVVVEEPDGHKTPSQPSKDDQAPAVSSESAPKAEGDVTYDGTASAGLNLSSASSAVIGDQTVQMIQNCMATCVGVTTKVSAATLSSYGYNSAAKQQDANGEVEYGSGSGIILTANGYIVTCAHVVEGGESVYVCMQDGTEYKAAVVGRDAQTDIAILKIEASDLPAATIGNSGEAVVGEDVYAIGNPLGEFVCSVSTGIVSGLNRTLDLDGMSLTLIQTDAAVNPGNSGGGLFNGKGELIGVVNAKTSSVGIEGLGFAIPIDSVKGIISDLMDVGYVTGRPYLGVTLQDVYFRSQNSNSYFGYGYTTKTQIVTVEKGSAAEKAGVKANDIVQSLNGTEIAGATELTTMLYEYKVGDVVTLTVLRGEESIDLKVTLGERSA